MVPLNSNEMVMEGEAEEMEGPDLLVRRNPKEEEESDNERKVEGRGVQNPLHRWVMHGAVMFGREFCYALEMALVTPVLLQIGLPEEYYSLTWFLSPILGLLFTPLIGSASDRCRLRWGRRRPFILALSVGVLLGIALFLNGPVIGLSIGDSPNNQPIGIILTLIGVVMLDFSADAAEGPIVAYLLSVANTEEQDRALNIHAVSAGLGGAVGYMLAGQNWMGTALGQVFKSQEQVLFLFAAIIFTVSVMLHMFSIPEQPLAPSNLPEVTSSGMDSTSQSSLKSIGYVPTFLSVSEEGDASAQATSQENQQSDLEEMDFLAVKQVRSKSDSVLSFATSTLELDPDLPPDAQVFLPMVHHFLPESQEEFEDAFKPSDNSPGASSPPNRSSQLRAAKVTESKLPKNYTSLLQSKSGSDDSRHRQVKAVNGINSYLSFTDYSNAVKSPASAKPGPRPLSTSVSSRPHRHTSYRQPSFSFSYYGRVGSLRYRRRRTTPSSLWPITTSRSLNDLSDLRHSTNRRELHLSAISLSSEGLSTEGGGDGATTVRLLWLSMFKMPRQLWRLCICHLITSFSLIAEAVFYTDFMGQVVFHGDPQAPANSTELQNYNRGVQMGCWGLVVYAATSAVCSAILQKYLDHFDLSIKAVYVVGTLGFSIGTAVMAIFPNVYVTMVMISSMGIISMSISYCPFALLGQYHEIKEYIQHSPANTRRGFGIDSAILTCQDNISQILVASALGAVVDAFGSVRVIPIVASIVSFLGFLAAFFLVIYPEMQPSDSQQELGLVKLSGGPDQNGERTKEQKLAPLNLTDRKQKTENHSVM